MALDGAPPKALPSSSEPLLLGAERASSPARDVFLALRPRDDSFPLFLALRERAARPALVLVPTSRAVTADLATRFAPGAHVEIEILEDTLVVRDGAIARVPPLRLVKLTEDPATSTPANPARTIAAEIGATSWAEIKITVIDGHTLRIQKGQRAIRRTYIDLGLASKGNREPTRKWALLLAICAGHGTFRWKTFGTFDAAKNTIAILRKALRETFGIEDDPFHEFTFAFGWKAKFHASSEIADG
jgi:hypothetical protein